MKNVYHANSKYMKAGVATRMADKINFKMRRITEIEERLVMTTGPPLQNDKVILQVNAAINSFKICEMKMDITKSRNRQNHIIVGGLTVPCSTIARKWRQKIQLFIGKVNNTTNQNDPIKIHKPYTEPLHSTYSFQEHMV